jgi:hypothetical protein
MSEPAPQQPDDPAARARSEVVTPRDMRRLLWQWTAFGLAGFAVPFVRAFMPTFSGHDTGGNVNGADFGIFWTGAKLAVSGGISRLYPDGAFLQAMNEFLGPSPWHIFAYPPHILPLIALFGLLPYFAALFAWSLLGTAALARVLRAGRARLEPQFLLLGVLSPAALFNLLDGQNGAFTAALFLGGFYISESAPLTAGVLFGLLTVKPQLGLLVPLALLLRRNWRCIGMAALTAFVLVDLSFLVWGTAPWLDYLHYTVPIQANALTPNPSLYTLMMPGPYADAALGMRLPHPWVFYAPAALFAVYAAAAAVRREGITARSVLVLALSTIIVTPYALNYDMVAVSGALVVYFAGVERQAPLRFLALSLLWALPLLLIEMKTVTILPLCTAILLSALYGLHREGGAPQGGSSPAVSTA